MREPLGSIDINFLTLHSTTTSQVIASLSVLNGVPDRESLRERVAAIPERFPRAKRRLKSESSGLLRLHEASWEDQADFSPDNHLHFVCVDTAQTLDELMAETSRIFSKGLDFSLPLWSFSIISSPLCEQSVMLFMVHHCFADGSGGMELVQAVCEPKQRGRVEKKTRERPLAVLREREDAPSRSWVAESRAWTSLKKAFTDMQIRRSPFSLHGENSAVREIRLMDFDLSRARMIKDSLRISLNDVFLGYVCGGIRNFLLQAGEIPRPVRVVIPFNLRPRTERNSLGNYLSAVPIDLPVSNADLIEQTLQIHQETAFVKQEGSFGSFGFLGRVASFLPVSLRRRLLLSASRRGNFICTNVPSSRQPLVVAGAPIVSTYGCAALLPEQGISVGFMSYVERVCLSLVYDPRIVKNPEPILDAFLRAEKSLFEAVYRKAASASEQGIGEAHGIS